MKKIKFLTTLFTLPALILPVCSCSLRTQGKLTLIGYTDASCVGIDNRDYWLTAEPATTNKIKAHGLTNVGNIQTLYGSNGFNQSVLVCKKSLIESNPQYLNQVKQYLVGNQQFVANESNRVNIINSINANLTEGKTETLTLANTTTQTLINCNSKYVETSSDKKSYQDFLNKARAIDEETIALPTNDEFYKGFPTGSTTSVGSTYKIICPDGAPAVGLSNLLCNKSLLCNTTNFEFVVPGNIMEFIGKQQPDLAVLPSNLAVKLYNNTTNYVWLSTITWGNLYILSKNYTTTLDKNNLNTLLDKNMDVLQLNSIPGIVLKIILKENNIDYVI